MANEVKLTFAGDSSDLEKAFDRVGASSKSMADDVGKSSRQVGSGFDRAGEAADNVDTKAMGFRDTMTGVQDTGLGLSKIMKGEVFEGFLTLGMGIGDLASGLYNFLIPAMGAAIKTGIRQTISNVKNTASLAAHRVATLASAAATTVMTVAQKGLNLALRANPIGLVITLLFAVGAALVLAYKKSETFRNIVDGAFRAVQKAASFAFNWITDNGAKLIGWFREVPGKISGAFGTLGSAIRAPFESAFNAIRSLWNSTVGGFGFSVPDWVPKVGGNSFTIPMMHTGGVMPGAPGTQGLALLMAGERVTPAGQTRAEGGPVIVQLVVDGKVLHESLVRRKRLTGRDLGLA